jgi:hypothetical protein
MRNLPLADRITPVTPRQYEKKSFSTVSGRCPTGEHIRTSAVNALNAVDF